MAGGAGYPGDAERVVAVITRMDEAAETVADTWRALNDGGYPRPKYLQGKIPVGLGKDKHDAVLAAWDARGSQA